MQETDHMHEGLDPKRRSPTRARLFTIAAVASGVLVAGCGGSSPSATTGGGASSTASAAANAGAATTSASSSPGSSPSGATRSELAELRQVHAGQRRSELPGPETRKGI